MKEHLESMATKKTITVEWPPTLITENTSSIISRAMGIIELNQIWNSLNKLDELTNIIEEISYNTIIYMRLQDIKWWVAQYSNNYDGCSTDLKISQYLFEGYLLNTIWVIEYENFINKLITLKMIIIKNQKDYNNEIIKKYLYNIVSKLGEVSDDKKNEIRNELNNYFDNLPFLISKKEES